MEGLGKYQLWFIKKIEYRIFNLGLGIFESKFKINWKCNDFIKWLK